MGPGKGFSIGLVGVLHQGPDASPGGEDVLPAKLHIALEVIAHLAHDPLDLLLGGRWVVNNFGEDIGGADHCASLPGQEKDHPAIAGGGVKESNVLRPGRENGGRG